VTKSESPDLINNGEEIVDTIHITPVKGTGYLSLFLFVRPPFAKHVTMKSACTTNLSTSHQSQCGKCTASASQDGGVSS